MMMQDAGKQSEVSQPSELSESDSLNYPNSPKKPHYSSLATLRSAWDDEDEIWLLGQHCYGNGLHECESLTVLPGDCRLNPRRLYESESPMTSGGTSETPPETPSPYGEALRKPLSRRRGPWRDAGFWLRIMSPGGTKHLLKKHNNNNNNVNSAKSFAAKSRTLPRNSKFLLESPPSDERCDLFYSRRFFGSRRRYPGNVKSPETPTSSFGSPRSTSLSPMRSPATSPMRLGRKSPKFSFFQMSPQKVTGSPEEAISPFSSRMSSLRHRSVPHSSVSCTSLEFASSPGELDCSGRILQKEPSTQVESKSTPGKVDVLATAGNPSQRSSSGSVITSGKSHEQWLRDSSPTWLNSAGVWDGTPGSSSCRTPQNCTVWDGKTSSPRSFERLTPRSRTLPRDLRGAGSPSSCGLGSALQRLTPRRKSCGRSQGGGGGSPWWWRILSPSAIARRILLPEKRKSPLSPPDIIIEWVDTSGDKKWARSNSLRRPFNRPRENNGSSSGLHHLHHHHLHHHHHHLHHHSHHHPESAAHSDTELGKISAPHSLLDGECGSTGGSVTSERGIDIGRVAAWASSFEKLLEDPAGLHTFAEFLKKEYSHENIYFWTACERYKRLAGPDELQAMAKVIFERHLCIGAPEPVNVDSQARQDAQDSLHNPNEFLFSQAQKQIFNLMKFDSYSRFLKSSLYQDCVARDMRGQTLPYPGDDTLDPDLRILRDDLHVTLKKSKSDADERRRKSLLPWNRKDRSKSKDRGEAEYRRQKKMGLRNQSDSSSVRSDMSGSRTSLNSSSDLALGRRAVSKESLTSGELGSLSGSEGYNRCRVILPDLSNSVVAVRHGESIQDLLTRLLERRGISYSTFDVYMNKTDKLLDKMEESVVLGGHEVRIEQRILFRLDLPNRKTVCVKAKPNKLTSEVLKPILHKYGYKLDLMSIHKVGEERGVNLKWQVNEIDGHRLIVQTKEEVKEWGIEPGRQKKRGGSNTLDEITNRVFEDLLKGKSQQNFDELGVLDFDARSSRTEHSGSDRSSGVTGGFGLRSSLVTEKDNGNKGRKPQNRSSVHDRGMMVMMPTSDQEALITKRRGNSGIVSNPTNAKQENDELYEGLKRAQRSRLDDQRGTEINFELPDFLKCHQPEDKENQHHLTDQLLAHLDCSFSEGGGGVIPSHQEAEDYFSMAHPEVWGGIPPPSATTAGATSPSGGAPHSPNATLMSPDLDLDDFDDTLVAEDSPMGPPRAPPPPPAPATASDGGASLLQLDRVPDFSPPPPPPISSAEENPTSASRMLHQPPPSLQLSPPPPPLPPKPKLGGAGRGPPPRPPSRQLHLLNPPTFSSTSDDEEENGLRPSDPPHPPVHRSSRQGSHHHHHDKFNISFV